MKKKEEQVKVEIPELEIKRTQITIVGDTPLIVKKFSQKAKEEIAEKQQKKAKRVKEGENVWETFIDSLHWLTPKPKEYTEKAFNEAMKKGAKFGFPATGIKQCIASGAYRKKMVKDKVSMYSAFHIAEELCEIKGTLTMSEDYARNPMTGGAVVCTRPKFTDWSITFTLVYDSTFSINELVNFINIGGFGVGIGCWRVEKAGMYGMFHVE